MVSINFPEMEREILNFREREDCYDGDMIELRGTARQRPAPDPRHKGSHLPQSLVRVGNAGRQMLPVL